MNKQEVDRFLETMNRQSKSTISDEGKSGQPTHQRKYPLYIPKDRQIKKKFASTDLGYRVNYFYHLQRPKHLFCRTSNFHLRCRHKPQRVSVYNPHRFDSRTVLYRYRY